ncbi:MAG TPA: ribosome maturation factor RimP [Cyclobacteriaceae bacterium]|nr:ribosome maturation factor RimP [Cyclobacteriaceae bacterium]
MDLQDSLAEIRKLAESFLKDESHFVVDVIASFRSNPKKLLVILDGDKGINIDDCAEISRQLSAALDTSNLIDGAFLLEVSTPGLDQPLKTKRQYVKNVGRTVKVKLKDKTVEGKLAAVRESAIEVIQQTGSGKKKEDKAVEIPLEEIDKTFVLVSFK